MKKILILILAMALLVMPWPAHALSGMEVVVLKIGKADAILLHSSQGTVLIDAGEDEDVDEILKFLVSRRIRKLDAMIITHFDKDHVGGADGVINGIHIDAVYDANYDNDSKEYKDYVKALHETGVTRHRVTEPVSLSLGYLKLEILPTALTLELGDDNNHSLAVAAQDRWHSFFFAGDAEEARIEELVDSGLGTFDIIKLPHHGRWKENLADLLEVTSPTAAIITDSDKNPADDATLDLLEQRGISIFETRKGDILIVSSRSGLTLTQ